MRDRGTDPLTDPRGVRAAILDVLDTLAAGEHAESSYVDVEAWAQELHDAVAGYGPLQRLFDDIDVEEIWWNEPTRVFCARRGRSELTTVVLSEVQVHDLVDRMCEYDQVSPDLPPGPREVSAVPKSPKRAALYVRISQDRSGEGLGVQRQEDDCRALTEERGWQVVGLYRDNDVSAYGRKKRPEYMRMLADVEAGEVDVIVAWHPDRLNRSPRELEDVIDLLDSTGCKVETVKAGVWDLSTASGRGVARILGTVARMESEQKADRQQRKNADLVKAGKLTGGGVRPFGYQGDRVTIDESEAEVIRDLAEKVLAGESLRSLAKDLNDRGVPTVTGALWSAQSLRYLLASARIAGLREHTPVSETRDRMRGSVVGPAVWDGIITEDQHTALRALFQRRQTGPGRPATSLLTGILVCGGCGGRMRAGTRDGRPCYRCAPGPKGCGGVSIGLAEVDQHVVEMARENAETPKFQASVAGVSQPANDDVVARLRRDEAALVAMGEDYDDGLVTRAEYLQRRERIEQRLSETRRSLEAQSITPAMTALLGGADVFDREWERLGRKGNNDQRRAVLSDMLVSVTVMPGTPRSGSVDLSRLRPDWRL